jgi:D-glycero-D-manno-heptose 1,7-bisphosphate phosphatase
MNTAVFFDRDNTLMKNIPYLGDPSKVEIFPFAKESVSKLHTAGFLIFLISNQSGVGRGYITKKQVKDVNDTLMGQLGRECFTDVYCCYENPNFPKEHCRKPHPKMIFQAQIDYDLELEQSYFVGDRLADMQAGKKAGCKCVYLNTDYHPEENIECQRLADYSALNLKSLAEWIILDSSQQGELRI